MQVFNPDPFLFYNRAVQRKLGSNIITCKRFYPLYKVLEVTPKNQDEKNSRVFVEINAFVYLNLFCKWTLHWSSGKVKLFLLFPASTVFHCTKLFSIISHHCKQYMHNHMLMILCIYFYLNWRNAKHHLTHSNMSLPMDIQEVHKCSNLKATLLQTSQDSFSCLQAAHPRNYTTWSHYSLPSELSTTLHCFSKTIVHCLVCLPPITSKLLDLYFQVCISLPL